MSLPRVERPSLIEMAVRLRDLTAPPSLSALITWASQGEELRAFLSIVEEFTPEHYQEIARIGECQPQMMRFAQAFEQRYFPLLWDLDWVDSYSEFPRGIPVPARGISWDDMHDLDGWRPGLLLCWALAESPYVDDDIRVTLLELCGQHVPPETLRRIPPNGWYPEVLYLVLDGTPYQSIATAVRWYWHDTGCEFLDVTQEEAEQNDYTWDMETVQQLATHWRRFQELDGQIDATVAMLEEDPPRKFAALLGFIEARLKAPDLQPRLADTMAAAIERRRGWPHGQR